MTWIFEEFPIRLMFLNWHLPPLEGSIFDMGQNKQQILEKLTAVGLVPVVRAKSADHLVELAQALLAGGVPVIEVTMTTPNAIEGIATLRRRFGQTMIIGVGTVLDADTARRAIDVGAEFVVSPSFDAETVAATLKLDKVSIPGAFTPTEIVRAATAGADLVKVFPSTALGPGYFKDVLAPLPWLRLMPTGGVELKNVGDWIRAGAVCLGVGSAMFPRDAMARNDWPAISAIAKAFAEAVIAGREK